MKRLFAIVSLLVSVWLLAFSPSAWAHKASDAYLTLGLESVGTANSAALPAQLSLALKDLDAAIESLDADNNRQLSWGEIRKATPALLQLVANDMQWLCAGNGLQPRWQLAGLERRSDGVYVRLVTSLDCPLDNALSLDYRFLKNIDPTHRLLVSGAVSGQPLAAVLAPQGRASMVLREGSATANLGKSASSQGAMGTVTQFFFEGIHHILTGFDHLAFLLALLLPLVLFSRGASGKASIDPAVAASTSRHRTGFAALLLTVTGFTIGHSLTLVLATLGWIATGARWIEPAIALTIAFSAALNLRPVRWIRSDVLALVFGMVHGLGFSSVLVEAGITGPLLLWGLLGFNLGVEVGQLVFVAVWCVLHWMLLPWRYYQTVVVKGGSVALLLIALWWAVQRLP